MSFSLVQPSSGLSDYQQDYLSTGVDILPIKLIGDIDLGDTVFTHCVASLRNYEALDSNNLILFMVEIDTSMDNTQLNDKHVSQDKKEHLWRRGGELPLRAEHWQVVYRAVFEG